MATVRRSGAAIMLACAFFGLSACGGGDSKDSAKTTKDASGMLITPKDTTKQAVTGGNWVRAFPGQPLSQNVDRDAGGMAPDFQIDA